MKDKIKSAFELVQRKDDLKKIDPKQSLRQSLFMKLKNKFSSKEKSKENKNNELNNNINNKNNNNINNTNNNNQNDDSGIQLNQIDKTMKLEKNFIIHDIKESLEKDNFMKGVHKRFVRKVLGILTTQFLTNFFFVFLCFYIDSLGNFILKYFYLVFVVIFILLFCIILLYFRENFCKKVQIAVIFN